MSKYKAAAKSFLQASVDHFDIPEVSWYSCLLHLWYWPTSYNRLNENRPSHILHFPACLVMKSQQNALKWPQCLLLVRLNIKYFLYCDTNYCKNCPVSGEWNSILKYYNELLFDYAIVLQMLSPNNVAIYGSLCALATFTRHELQIHVITSRYVLGSMNRLRWWPALYLLKWQLACRCAGFLNSFRSCFSLKILDWFTSPFLLLLLA